MTQSSLDALMASLSSWRLCRHGVPLAVSLLEFQRHPRSYVCPPAQRENRRNQIDGPHAANKTEAGLKTKCDDQICYNLIMLLT